MLLVKSKDIIAGNVNVIKKTSSTKYIIGPTTQIIININMFYLKHDDVDINKKVMKLC